MKIVRFKIEVGVSKIFAKMQHLFQVQIVAYSATAARHPGCHEIVSSWKVSLGRMTWRFYCSMISVQERICFYHRGMKSPRNKVSVDDNYTTCAVQSNYFDRRWLLRRRDFIRDTGCALLWPIAIEVQCNVNGRSLLIACWLLMYNPTLLAKNNWLVP